MADDDFDYSTVKLEGSTEAINAIGALAKMQLQLEMELAEIDAARDAKAQELRRVSEFDLPEAMTVAGMSEFKTADGAKVTIKKDYIVNISKEHQAAAYAWLAQNNLDSIIKRDVRVQFGKGEGADADKAVSALHAALGADAAIEDKRAINAQTLKATIKGELAKQVDVPQDLFGLIPLKKAIIKLAKNEGL